MISSHKKIRVSRQSTKDIVYLELKNQIINGTLKPNELVNEETLSNDLEFSRTPIREAIQKLEMEDLVIRLPNGRLKIAPISVEEVNEIYELREVLEGLLTKHATINMTKENLDHLRIININLLEAGSVRDTEKVIQYGNEFHEYLYQVSNNKKSLKILQQLNDHIARYRRIAPKRDAIRNWEAANEHNEIFISIEEKDYVKAEKLMRVHIRKSKEAVIKNLEI